MTSPCSIQTIDCADRILVMGLGASGKTTFCRKLSAASGIPVVSADDLHHGKFPYPRPEFIENLRCVSKKSKWIIDGAVYDEVFEILGPHADVAVWLDPPKWRNVLQAAARSLRRTITRERLWSGEVDSPLAWRRADHSVRWVMARHGERRSRFMQVSNNLATIWDVETMILKRVRDVHKCIMVSAHMQGLEEGKE